MSQLVELYGLLFFVSLSATVIITLPISKLAYHMGIVDQPGFHKTHSASMPLLGGLAIFIGIVFTMLIFSVLSTKLLTLFLGSLILVITGLLDDIYYLKPLLKMAGQTAAAATVVLFNTSYFSLFTDLFERYYLPGGFALFLIIGWIVLMVNAFNIIDGLDGLAAGTAAIIFAAMAVINLLNGGSTNMFALQVMGAGACIGFLFYNFYPARIFMGDTGSMLLGFLLATTYILSLNGSFSGSLVLGSIFIFAYPALDVTFAIFRRLIRRVSIFQADQGHIHHVLLSITFSVRRTVLILYLVNICFALLSIALLSLENGAATIMIIGAITLFSTLALFWYLTIISKRNGLHTTGNKTHMQLQPDENW